MDHDIKTLQQLMVAVAVKVAKNNAPETFMAWFSVGILASVIGNLPDEYWKECMTIEPCGQPGCDCHEIRQQLFSALDRMREDFKKTTATPPPPPCD